LICTPQGPYCAAYPVDGQQGSFYFPTFSSIGIFTPVDGKNVQTGDLRCATTPSRIIPRDEMGTSNRLFYSASPQYTGGFNPNGATSSEKFFAYEARNWNTYSLLDGTGQFSAQFWRRASALRIASADYEQSFVRNAGNRMPAWITHLDINNGISWSAWDLELISSQCVNTPFTDRFGAAIPTCLKQYYVRTPSAYAQGPVQSPYSRIDFADAGLYTFNGIGVNPIGVGRSVCQVDCGILGPDFQCNLAGTKCECIPPLYPVMAADGVSITSCSKGQPTQWDWDWPMPQLSHLSNFGANSVYRPVDNARGMCFTDISGALLANATSGVTGRMAWCREYGGLTFTERCSGHGWHLQYRNERDDYPTVVDMDCRCDSGWSGKRCHAQCWRLSTNDTCFTVTHHSCDMVGYKRSSISSGVCVPNNLITISPIVSFFTDAYANNGGVVYQANSFDKLEPSTQNLLDNPPPPKAEPYNFRSVLNDPICYFDAATFRLPNSLSSLAARPVSNFWFAPGTLLNFLCERTYVNLVLADGPVEYRKTRGFVPLKFAVVDESNYPCNVATSSDSNTALRNSSTNPCAYGTNPLTNPLHIGEPSGYVPIRDPVNYNTAGIDRHILMILNDNGNTFNTRYFSYYQSTKDRTPMAESDYSNRDNRNTQYIANFLAVGSPYPGSRALRTVKAENTAIGQAITFEQYLDASAFSGYEVNGQGPPSVIIARCKGTNIEVVPGQPCAPVACKAGTAGRFCEIICTACNSDQHCDDGRLGTGQCVCDNPLAFLNTNTLQCSTQGCGNANNLCSGAGVCISSGIEPFCSCNAGFDGIACQIDRSSGAYNVSAGSQVYDECDCSVLWRDYQLVDRLHPIPAGLAILSDFSPLLAPLAAPILYNGVVNVGGSDQARQMCHKDALCVGFAMHILTDYWRQTGQIDVGISVYRAIFFYQTNNANAPVNGGVVFPSGISVEFHSVSRYEGYACPSSQLQVQPFYYNTYYTTVQTYCQQLLQAYALANPSGTPISQSACSSNDMFVSHWRYQGHLARLSPNANCVLAPSLYSQETYCRGSRCPTNGNVPCSGVGVCQQVNQNYQCACEKFTSATSTGALGLNGNPRFLGNSCQFSVSTLCVQPQAATICSDNPSRCRPRLVFNSNFFNGDSLDVSNSTDYIPFCDCAGTNLQGTYCEQSRCGLLSGGCKSLSAAAGDCVLQNPSTQEYACVCQQSAIGRYCEIEASSCLNRALQLKCSAQGDCLEKDINHARPWCNCRNGAFGEFCENSDCPSDVMVPGHGQCVNRQLEFCYDVYQGVRCEVDRCALWDGEVQIDRNGLPSTCSCKRDGWSNKFQNATVPSCWPQCPVLNGQMCGVFEQEPHGCNQNELGGLRYALCVCAEGYIQVDHPSLPGVKVCEKYCKHGSVPSNWDPASPTPCVCDASTGFDILMNSPRCDHPICANDGVYDVATRTCVCPPPFSAFNKCTTNSCGAGNSVTLWTDAFATSKYRCQCVNPYKPRFENAPFDCAGSACGLNGYLNPFYTTATSPANLCLCTGRWRSNCTSLTNVCSYCTTSTCLNNGVALQSNPKLCVCPVPFANGPLGLCEISACAGNSQTLSVVSGRCVCAPGFQGPLCGESLCQNQGIFNAVSQRCVCPSTAAGFFCDVLLIDYFPIAPGLRPSSSSTGGPPIGIAMSSTASGPVAPPAKSHASPRFADVDWLWLHTLACALAATLLMLG
jgi:hypothetical protein